MLQFRIWGRFSFLVVVISLTLSSDDMIYTTSASHSPVPHGLASTFTNSIGRQSACRAHAQPIILEKSSRSSPVSNSEILCPCMLSELDGRVVRPHVPRSRALKADSSVTEATLEELGTFNCDSDERRSGLQTWRLLWLVALDIASRIDLGHVGRPNVSRATSESHRTPMHTFLAHRRVAATRVVSTGHLYGLADLCRDHAAVEFCTPPSGGKSAPAIYPLLARVL